MAIDPSELEQVFHDNQRVHQIGGLTDGITPEVASDLGFSTAQEAAEIAKSFPEPLHPVTQLALESQGIEAPSATTEPAPYRGDAYEGDVHPAYHDKYVPLTAKQKAEGAAGVIKAKEIFKK